MAVLKRNKGDYKMHKLIKHLEATLIEYEDSLADSGTTAYIIDMIDDIKYEIGKTEAEQERPETEQHGTWNKTQTGVE